MDLSALSVAGKLSACGARPIRWRPDLPCVLHSEVFACGNDGAGTAAALALALVGMQEEEGEERSFLWVQDAESLRRNGRPYRPGLPTRMRHRLIHVVARKPKDALFALEEGLRCRDLACVIGEIAGNPRAFDFIASRRLSLAAEKHGIPLFLVRFDARRDLSAARMRWQVRSEVSPPPRWNAMSPGPPTWRTELFRSRTHAPGEWILHALPGGLSASGLTPSLERSDEDRSHIPARPEEGLPRRTAQSV